MPVGEIVGELLGGLFRFLGHIFIEVFFEIVVKKLGYAVCKVFKKDVDPDGLTVIVTGLSCWVFIGFVGYALFRSIR